MSIFKAYIVVWTIGLDRSWYSTCWCVVVTRRKVMPSLYCL